MGQSDSIDPHSNPQPTTSSNLNERDEKSNEQTMTGIDQNSHTDSEEGQVEPSTPHCSKTLTASPASTTSWWRRPFSRKAKAQEDIQWRIHWYMPTSMILLGVAGLCGAVAHHVYNSSLHGQLVQNPQWPQRYGAALAFFTKMCLVGAVEIAYKQQSWRTAQKHALQIETFDAMFSACNDPLQFFSLELIRKATVPTLLAGLVWVLPLCAIASPASLTSAASSLNTTLTCDDIPNLDFSRENSYGPDSVNADGEGLSYWDFEDDNRVYYTGPSMDFQRLSTLSLLSKTGPLQPSNPCVGGGNCSYAVSFDGPAYKCEEQPDFDSNIPMKKGNLAPDGNYTYYGYSSTSEEIGGRPAEWSNATDDKIGVFYDEPALWIGYVINTTEPFNSSESSLWHHKLDPKVMKCTLYNATYSYTLSFMNGVMFVNNSKTNFISPLLEEGASVSPNASNYKAFAGFHAAGFLFCKTMYNAINQSGESGWSETYSDISQTTLVDADTSLTVPNFPSAVETKFADLVLSIMSDDIMHSKIHISVPCTMANIVLVWNYAPLWLWLSYGAALLTTLVAVAVGAAAISRNGYAVDTNFSTFLATTRSKDLDDIAEGSCLGQTPLAKDFMGTRLQYGEVPGGDIRVKHAAFGFPGNIKRTTFGETYE